MAVILLKINNGAPTTRGLVSIYFHIGHNSRATTIKTGVYIKANYWLGDVTKAVGSACPNAKNINDHLEALYFKYSNTLRDLEREGRLANMSIVELRKALTDEKKGKRITSFDDHFEAFISRKEKGNTIISYQLTLSKIKSYAAAVGKKYWLPEDITLEWLIGFEQYLKKQHLDKDGEEIKGVRKLNTNGIAIHFRNLRAVVNSAIDEGLTDNYPFRKFKIKQEQTKKRSLSVEQVRTLRDLVCEPHEEIYRDMFMLIIYMVGINPIDLFSLTEIANQRVEYRRSKTGKLIDIKIEPEALDLIQKYKGESYLVNVGDTHNNYKSFVDKMNIALRKIGELKGVAANGKKDKIPLVAGLSGYWARHTWATLAAELDIPDATISAALGHSSGNKVTNIYINRDRKKVDEANRKVIDYIFEDSKNGTGII